MTLTGSYKRASPLCYHPFPETREPCRGTQKPVCRSLLTVSLVIKQHQPQRCVGCVVMMHLWVVAKPLPPGGVCAITVCTQTCEQTCTLVRMLTVARQGQTCMRYCSSDAVLEMPLIQPGASLFSSWDLSRCHSCLSFETA